LSAGFFLDIQQGWHRFWKAGPMPASLCFLNFFDIFFSFHTGKYMLI